MCGVPVVSAEGYLQRLIRKGFRVAVCEQVEDPAEARKRGAKAVVRREVIRLVTPGTLSEDALLDARAANYLAALAQAEGNLALAWAEMSTGEFAVMGVSEASLPAALARLEPGEILVPEPLLEEPALFELFAEWKEALTPQPRSLFDSVAAGTGARGVLRFGFPRRSRLLRTRGACRRRRRPRLSQAHPEEPDAEARAAPLDRDRRCDGDRRRDPAQPGAHGDPGRRHRRQPALGDRPHRHRRGRPAAQGAAHRAAHRARCHRRAARFRRLSWSRRMAPGAASGSGSVAARTWSARSRASAWGAAGRATSPRCAMRSARFRRSGMLSARGRRRR